jgi:hypothetical protein
MSLCADGGEYKKSKRSCCVMYIKTGVLNVVVTFYDDSVSSVKVPKILNFEPVHDME